MRHTQGRTGAHPRRPVCDGRIGIRSQIDMGASAIGISRRVEPEAYFIGHRDDFMPCDMLCFS